MSNSPAGFTRVEPLCPRCEPHLLARRHACFGVSPFNGCFTRDRVTALAGWGRQQFASMHFFVPDVPAAATLEAVGYPPHRAAHKARRQANLVRNKIRAALDEVGVATPDRLILDWAALISNPTYQRLRDEVLRLFDDDPSFRRSCLAASRWVLCGQQGPDATDDQVACAVRYLLAELPLFADTAGIVGEESSVFCYHQPMPFVETFFAGRLVFKPSPRQGFALVTTGDALDPTPASPL